MSLKRNTQWIVFCALAVVAAGGCGETEAEAVLHRVVADARSYDANAYWIESEQGVVLIDALFLRPDAERLAAEIKASARPLAGIIITHPHVDHFGGARWLLDTFGDVPVFATHATAEGIQRTHDDAYKNGWIKAYGDDYASQVVVPDRVVESGAEVEIAGLHFTLQDFGPMEAENNTVVYSRELRSVFVGDALLSGYIYYVGEGHSRQVLEQLPAIGAAFPEAQVVHSGHGEEAGLAPLIEENLAQVRFMRETLAGLAADEANLNAQGNLTAAAREVALQALIERFGDHKSYGIPLPDFFKAYILPGLEAELKAERASRSCC
jgi:glyoxylase-like metal-dependent hydrolase (beta-lactamase superfamily II)